MVYWEGFNIQLPGCAFETKAKRRMINRRPDFFTVATLFFKATEK
jgi:hypothetical protein